MERMVKASKSKKDILREFYERRYSGEVGVAESIAEREGITKQRVYQIVKEVHTGKRDFREYNEAERIRKDALWRFKYAKRWAKLPHNRKADTVKKVKKLVCEMIEDGFNPTDIERLSGKHRTTVIHHAATCVVEVVEGRKL